MLRESHKRTKSKGIMKKQTKQRASMTLEDNQNERRVIPKAYGDSDNKEKQNSSVRQERQTQTRQTGKKGVDE